MNNARTWQSWLRHLSVIGRVFLLAGGVALIWMAVAAVSFRLGGMEFVIASAVGAGLCLVGAELALVIAALFRGPMAVMYGAVFGMLPRMAVPLLGGVALHLGVPSLKAAGMIFYLIGFFLVTLAFETTLMLAQLEPNPSGDPSSGDTSSDTNSSDRRKP